LASARVRALARGESAASENEWAELLAIIDDVMRAHAGFEK
jgi:hypothetical protein